jgi:transposase
MVEAAVRSIYSFSALIWSFMGRQCVGCDHRCDVTIEVSSRRLPLVPPHRLLLEKPQINQRTEYLDPTGPRRATDAGLSGAGVGDETVNKNDPNDALSVALAALRTPRLRVVEPANHAEVLRLLSKRNSDIVSHRIRVVCRLHALFQELAPGGMAKKMNASDAGALLATLDPTTQTERIRYELATELYEELCRIEVQHKASEKRIKEAVKASGTSVTEIYGVGPVLAAQLIGYSGDVRRFANRDAYASYNGTAPVEFSSGGRVVHRVSQRGNRMLNHAVHMTAITQIRQPATQGRVYFERRVAEGKTKREALRSLKRHVSNAIYRQLVFDAQ